MPIHVMQCVQGAANDEIIRRINAIRNQQILKRQYEFQFSTVDKETKNSSLQPELSHHRVRSFQDSNDILPVLLKSIERLSNYLSDTSHRLKRPRHRLMNHDSIDIGSLNVVAIMSEDSQRLSPDLPSTLWAVINDSKQMIISRFSGLRFRISP